MAEQNDDELHAVADEITSDKERGVRALARRIDAGEAAMPLVWPGGPFSDPLARAMLNAVSENMRWIFRTDVLGSDAKHEASQGGKKHVSQEKIDETAAGKIRLMLEGAGLSVQPPPPEEPPTDAGSLVKASRGLKEASRVDRIHARILYRANVVGAAIEQKSADEPLRRIDRRVADELIGSNKALYQPALLDVDAETDIDATAQYIFAHAGEIDRFRSILRSAAPSADDALLYALARDLALLVPVEGEGVDDGWESWLGSRAISRGIVYTARMPAMPVMPAMARALVDSGWIDPPHLPKVAGLTQSIYDQSPHLITLAVPED